MSPFVFFLLFLSLPSQAEEVIDAEVQRNSDESLNQKLRTPFRGLKNLWPFKQKGKIKKDLGSIGISQSISKSDQNFFRKFKGMLGFPARKKDSTHRSPGENAFTDIVKNVMGDLSPYINAFVRNSPASPGKTSMKPYVPSEHRDLVDLKNNQLPFFKKENLDSTKFKILWTQKSLGELRIRNLWIVQELVLLETFDSELFGLDLGTGYVQWVYEFEKPLDLRPVLTEKGMYAVAGGVLYYISQPATKTFDWRRPMQFVATTNPVHLEDRLIFGALFKRLYVYNIKRRSIQYKVPTVGTVISQPILINRQLIFSTKGGYLYNLNIDSKKYLWKYTKPIGEFSSTAVVDSHSEPWRVFVGSDDHHLLGLDFSTGSIARVGESKRWEMLLSGPISKRPILHGKELLLAVADGDGLFAINRKKATERWFVPGVQRVVSTGADEIYCLNNEKEFIAIKIETGQVKWRHDFTPFDFISDTLNQPQMIVATNSGQIYALQPPSAEKPKRRKN